MKTTGNRFSHFAKLMLIALVAIVSTSASAAYKPKIITPHQSAMFIASPILLKVAPPIGVQPPGHWIGSYWEANIEQLDPPKALGSLFLDVLSQPIAGSDIRHHLQLAGATGIRFRVRVRVNPPVTAWTWSDWRNFQTGLCVSPCLSAVP